MEVIVRILKLSWFYVMYAGYVVLTSKQRREYQYSLQNGCKCTGSYDDSYVLYGSATVFEYDKSESPERDYWTLDEFKEVYHPYLKGKLEAEKVIIHNGEMKRLQDQINELNP